MNVTLSPKLKVVMFKQPENAPISKDPSTPQLWALKSTVVSPLQPENAIDPIEVTELGMVMDVILSTYW